MMENWHDIEFWRTATILFAALGQTLFVVLYFTFPWYLNFLGRALFFKGLAFALLVDVAIAGRIWDWNHEDEMIVILYGILGFGIWVQFAAFLRVWVEGRAEDVSGNPTSHRDNDIEEDL